MTSTHYAPVADTRVAVLVQWLTLAEREAFEESAGIRQHDGGLSQARAEVEALLDILALRGAQPKPVVRVFRLALPDASLWVLANDVTQALAYLHDQNGIDITEEAPADVLACQFGGLAFLTTSA